MNKKKQKILVYMSGGVDSSVATALLIKAGYDVTGAFMVDYDDPERPGSCWHGDYEDALRVCAKLGIKLLRLDFRKEYKKLVLDYMYKEYKAGRTPNPDVLCNKYIKFGVWLEKARELGFDCVSTGHYARLEREIPNPKSQFPNKSKISKSKSKIKLLQAKDGNKDQTYFLHQLTQEQLRSVVFPLGKYTKPEVRKLAQKFNLPTAEKEESMGICFIGEVPMKEFLQKKIKPKKGKIINSAGEILGEHDGLAFYTIGQRIGINCHSDRDSRRVEESLKVTISRDLCATAKALGDTRSTTLRSAQDDSVRPLFVVGKNIRANKLVVGYEDDPMLHKKEIQVGEINWISGQPPKFPLKCKVRLRHRQELQNCAVVHSQQPIANSNIKVLFTKSQRAPTPGQFAVFYLKGECLGGGVIIL